MSPLHRLGRALATETIDSNPLWGPLGVLIGALGLVVAVVVAIVMYRRQFPKQRMEYRVTTRRLISHTLAANSFSLSVRGIPVSDPYFTTISVRSNSRADIPSDAFDSGQAIVIRVQPGGAILLEGETEGEYPIRFGPGEGEGMDWAEFPIPPQLIRKRSRGELSFVSQGSPTVQVNSPLINIDFRRTDTDRNSEMSLTAGAAKRSVVVAALSGASAMVIGVLTTVLVPVLSQR